MQVVEVVEVFSNSCSMLATSEFNGGAEVVGGAGARVTILLCFFDKCKLTALKLFNIALH
jgi:hypothetical protein